MVSSAARSRVAIRIEDRFPRLWRSVGRPAAQILEAVGADELGVEAGSMTYGAFLSIPPMLLLTVTVLDVFFSNRPDAADRLIAGAESALPGLGELVGGSLRLNSKTVVGAGVFGVATLVWAASGFAVRVRHALGAVFRTELLGLVTGRLGAALRGVPVLLVLVSYTAAISWATTRDVAGLAGLAIDVLAYLALLVAGVLVWTTVYRWITPGRAAPSFRNHVVGGAAYTIAFLVLERFGAAYVDNVVAHSRALYGAIGALFGLFAFLYLAMWSFLLGAELTKVWRSVSTASAEEKGA
jgi:YihY family inner membrane protein